MPRQILSRTTWSAALFGALLGLSVFAWSSVAAAQIQRPGAHPRYSVELEPHLVVQHERNWAGDDQGIGPGLRVSIPLVHNGPIPRINNNIGIGFGFDWTHFDDCDFNASPDCDVDQIWLPVVAQWNFFFTPVVSVFGEVGPALVYRKSSFEVCPAFEADCDDTDFDVFEPVFYGGGRFLFSRSVGLVVRLGFPSVSIGATFLL